MIRVWKYLNLRSFTRGLSDSSKKDVGVPDVLVQNVKACRNPLQVLDIVSSQKKLSLPQTMHCLRALFQFQKLGSGETSINSKLLIQHPEFETLCTNLKSHSRALEPRDTIDALKILSYFGLSSSSRILTQLLSIIRYQINDISLSNIVFLDFLLRKLEPIPLVEALTIALPMLFEAQLTLQLDHENVKELVDCLGFVARNRISEKSVNSIITALTLHGEDLSVHDACSIVWSLCDIYYVPNHQKLLQNCFTVLSRGLNELDFHRTETTLSRVIEKFRKTGDAAPYYNESFFNKIAEIAVQHDNGPERIMFILKHFNTISYVNFELLNNAVARCLRNPQFLRTCSVGFVFTLVSSLACASYTPSDWDVLVENIKENPLFTSRRVDLPWFKFANEFSALGGFHPELTEWLFCDNFLKRHFDRENNKIDQFLLLTFYQYVKLLQPDYQGSFPSTEVLEKIQYKFTDVPLPLLSSLKYLYGGKQLFNRVTTTLGHFIDHVLMFDSDGNVLNMNEMEVEDVLLEDLLHPDRKIIAIISPPKTHYIRNLPERLKGTFETRVRGLETIVPVVVISQKVFSSLADFEKLPYLQQKIQEKLHER